MRVCWYVDTRCVSQKPTSCPSSMVSARTQQVFFIKTTTQSTTALKPQSGLESQCRAGFENMNQLNQQSK